MSASNFQSCLKFTLRYEGGYVDHPADPGGATNLGITIHTLRKWRGESVTKADVRALTLKEAGQIYKSQYWDTVQGDKLPPGVDLMVFDFGVNSGPSRAAKALQRAVGTRQDGVIGLDTIEAVHARKPADVINAISEIRGGFFRSLKTFKTFGKGWMARNTAVRQAALGMARGYKPHEAPDDPGDKQPSGAAKADPADRSMTASTTGNVIAGGGAISAATPAIEAMKKAQEAAEAGKGIGDVMASVGPWVLLAVVIVGLAAYAWWRYSRKAQEQEVL